MPPPAQKVIGKIMKFVSIITWIEYLSPLSEESPFLDFLQNKGEGFHHIAYQVDSIENVIDTLPVESQVSCKNSDVGDWLVADIHPKYSMGLRMQITEECSRKVKNND